MDKILETAFILLNNAIQTSTPRVLMLRPFYGQTVEVNCPQHYFRKQSEYRDAVVGSVMSTELQL